MRYGKVCIFDSKHWNRVSVSPIHRGLLSLRIRTRRVNMTQICPSIQVRLLEPSVTLLGQNETLAHRSPGLFV